MERTEKNFKSGHFDMTLLGRKKDQRLALWL